MFDNLSFSELLDKYINDEVEDGDIVTYWQAIYDHTDSTNWQKVLAKFNIHILRNVHPGVYPVEVTDLDNNDFMLDLNVDEYDDPDSVWYDTQIAQLQVDLPGLPWGIDPEELLIFSSIMAGDTVTRWCVISHDIDNDSQDAADVRNWFTQQGLV